MRKVLFQALGTAHGIAGLVTLVIAAYVVQASSWVALPPAQYLAVAMVSGILVFICLISCGAATWVRPSLAAPLAWLAAFGYFAPMFALALKSGYSLTPEFYHSAWIRVLAAGALTLLADLRQRKPSRLDLRRK